MAIESLTELFEKEWPTSAETWMPGGKAPAPGSLFRNPVLADTWERVLAEAETVSGREAQIDKARDAFYRGFIAEAIDDDYLKDACVMDGTGERRKGVLTAGGHGKLERPLGGSAHPRLRRLDRLQDRPLEPGAGAAAKPATAETRGHRRYAADGRRFRPYGDRGDEALLRGSGGLLRRSRFLRYPDGAPALRPLRGRARQADRHERLFRAAPGCPPRIGAAGAGGHRPGGGQRETRRRRGRGANPPWRICRTGAAIPCIST